MSEPMRVLIVEDSEDDTLLMLRELQRARYAPRYERVETAEALSVALTRKHWDLILSDYTMPHFRGTDALEILKKTGLDIPFIFVSGTLGEDAAVAAMKAGANDYMRKNNLKRLIPAIERELREANARRERKAAEERSRRHQEQIRALHEINLTINSTLELQTILDVLLEKMDSFLPQPAVSNVDLFDREKARLEPAAGKNPTAAGEVPAGLCWQVFETKAPLLIRNIEADPRAGNPRFFREHGVKSYLGLPLIAEAEPLGVLSFYTGSDHGFSDDEIRFFSTVAGQAAIAIEKATLYQALKKQAEELKRANKVKTEFLTVTSHELRTPLTTVIGYTSTMREGLLGVINPRQEEALERVLRSSSDLLAMINSILDAARLEAEPIVVDKKDVNLWGFIEEIRSDYALPLGKELTLIWDLPTELPYIRTDRERLKHIVENLINNAIKFTREGTVRISLRCLLETSTLQFRISDNGPGIPKETLPFIFEMFRQADSSESRVYGGVGLGLYIVKRFSELLGGTVAVDSKTSVGSTFTVTIPYEEVPASRITVQKKRVPGRSLDDDRVSRLYESEAYEAAFRAFLGFEIDAMVAVDSKGQVVFINDQVVKMFGYSREELIGRPVEILLPERLRKAHARYLRSYASNPRSRPFGAGLNLIGRRKDGAEFPAEISLRPMITEAGLLVVSIIRDFTKVRCLEKTLEQKTKWLSMLGELIASASQLPDLDLFLQDALLKLGETVEIEAGRVFILDERRKELRLRAYKGIPRRLAQAGHPVVGEGIVGRVAETGDTIIFEDIDRNSNAGRLGRGELALGAGFRAYACLPIKVKDKVAGVLNLLDRESRRFSSHELGLIASMADQIGLVIERANLYEELKRRSAEIEALARKIKQKTSNLQKAASARDAFLGLMSHELRTPLNVIIGFAALMEERGLGEINQDQQKALQKILRNAWELLAMMDNMLRAVALEAGDLTVVAYEVTLKDTLDELKSTIILPPDKDLKLIWKFPLEAVTIKTDGQKLKHILANLIHNAIKFTEKGSVIISARCLPEARNIQFQVTDTGMGIPAESLDAIFLKFQQLNNSQTSPYGGVGLGLYIVKKYAELLRARVKVQSEPEKGSTFILTIPVDVETP